ncbi:cytochrome C oxidase subunit IV family protein [Protofrankia coriariae]|uniref:cytochrome C oxidase subunit IV family protein n=1 Tax=Protofrankia coriariae TaxID=1562887 RepID=UPI000640459B|nr:cytochrome C oxidase subunit IV family protein [Protofrankia coriariae]
MSTHVGSTVVKGSAARISVVRNPTVVSWLALMGATVLSWYLGEGHGAREAATVGVIVVAFFKVYLVGRYFMELREAPQILHLLFAGWAVVVCVVLVAMYLTAGD